MGLNAARDYAERLVAEAQQALSGFDARADRLRQLAAFVTERRN